MEGKVPGSSDVGVMLRFLAGAASGLVLSFPAHAGGGITGGATELTQLLNHAELIAQVGEAVQTTSNTLMTAQSTMQMLRQLPAAVIDGALSGLPVEQVQAMADAYKVMNEATGVYKDAENVLRKAEQDAKMLNITPSELLQHKANAAAMHGGIYLTSYEAEQARIKRAAEMSKEVQKQAEIVKGIDSQVGGIQALASQNVAMQATLATISTSISEANANAYLEAEKAKNAESLRNKQEAAADKEFRANQKKAEETLKKISTDGLIPR